MAGEDILRGRKVNAAQAESKPLIKPTLPRKTVYCLLFVLVLLNIAYRYPVEVTHELGSDTTFIHSLAGSVVNNGHAKWVLNPISLFGLYALSYPSGVPFILAEFSELSGLSIEGTIFLFGLVLGISGALSSFLVSRELFRHDVFAFLVAFLFSLAPFFLKDTTWVGSSRGAVVALIPVILLLLIRSIKLGGSRYFLLAILVSLVAWSLHRMGLLVVFFFISFFFISSIHKITQKIRFALVRYELLFRVFASVTALSGFILVFWIQIIFPGYGGFNIVEVYGKGSLFEGTDLLTMLLNMGVNFVGKVGILVPLSLLGLVVYVWKRPKRIDEKFVLVVTLLLIPFLSLRDYISEFLILLFVLMAVFLFLYIQAHWRRWKKGFIVAALAFLVISMGFSWVMKDHWRNKYRSDTPISEGNFDASMYIDAYGEGVVLTNFGLTAGRISALTEGPVLPLGGASLHWRSPQQLAFGTTKSPNLLFFPVSELSVRRLNYDEITFTTDEIFAPTNAPNALVTWETILRSHPDSSDAIDIAERWDIHYVVASKIDTTRFYTYGRWMRSSLLEQIQMSATTARYKIFEGSEDILWFYR
ncbi:MAG: hypothetical protein ACE5QF_02265 [Thermoplasmata archaeon]